MAIKQSTIEAIARWRSGDIVWSFDVGGIGPGYEQAIQVLIFETASSYLSNRDSIGYPNGDSYPPEFDEAFEKAVSGLGSWGISGQQAAAAKSVAFKFLYNGYEETMQMVPDERKIIVSNTMEPKLKMGSNVS